MMLEFDEKHHAYFYDGEPIPCVSEIIRFIAREVYGETDKKAMDNAAARGTRIHRAAEEIDRKGYTEIDTDILQYVSAYVKFLKENDVEWELIEEPVISPSHAYAGTLDRCGMVNGRRLVVDIKTTATIGSKHKILYATQLTAYAAAIPPIGDNRRFIDGLAILQLKKDGTYKLIPVEMETGLLASCLMLHQSLTKKKGKKVSK